MRRRGSLLFMALLLAAVPAIGQSRSVDITGSASFIRIGEDAERSLEVENDVGFTVGLNVFIGDRFSLDFTAGLFEPEASIALPTVLVFRTIKPQVVSAATVGKLKMIPLTAALQYHFKPEGRIDPYIGGGVEYVLLGNFDSADDIDFEEIDFNDDLGAMVNAGVSFDLGRNLALTLDAKYVAFDDGVTTAGDQPLATELHPLIVSAGLSWQF